MSRFYGFTYYELMEMPIDIYQSYYSSIKILGNRERLEDLEVISYPKMAKRDDREKVRKKYLDGAKNGESKGVTGLDMARKLAQWQTKK